MITAIALAAFLFQAGPAQPALPSNSPAYDGDWLVEIIDNIKVLPESRVTITIRSGTNESASSISGSASCNTYRGTFTLTDDRVKVGQLLRTMKACDTARMSEEADFFAILSDVVSVEVRANGALVLRTNAGRTITARRAPATRD